MNLLNITDTNLVSKTSMSKKLTIDGKTEVYPVYRVRLDQLFYNDQNDRIATWMSKYKLENGVDAMHQLPIEEYNNIISNFIVESNTEAMKETQTDILLKGQLEPGVVLVDGRIIDGNRRYTCLRELSKEHPEKNYFETVILDSTIESNRKSIKMLELSIQHGTQQRVGYNLIDLAIGAYQDIEETKLLTVEEYASSTNESVGDVKKRLGVAKMIVEFLEYIHLPKQYHVARERTVFSVFFEMQPILKKFSSSKDKEEFKEVIYNNVMFQTFLDQRKFSRDIKGLYDSGFLYSYIQQQLEISSRIKSLKDAANISTKEDLEAFCESHQGIKEEMAVSLELMVLNSKKKKVKEKPIKSVTKSINTLSEVQSGVFKKLNDVEKKDLKEQLDRLAEEAKVMSNQLGIEEKHKGQGVAKVLDQEEVTFTIGERNPYDPIVVCNDDESTITDTTVSLSFTVMKLSAKQHNNFNCQLFFINDKNQIVSDVYNRTLEVDKTSTCLFTFKQAAFKENKIFLAVKSDMDQANELQAKLPFKVNL